MEDRKRNTDMLLWLLVIISIIVACNSCTTTRVVTVPEVHETVSWMHDSVLIYDSIHTHDSVMVVLMGDTVYKEKYSIVYRDRWRDHLRIDSFIQHDTITVVKEVERPPGFWQKAMTNFREILLTVILVGSFVFILTLYVRKRKG